jgi:hypothetical protein
MMIQFCAMCNDRMLYANAIRLDVMLERAKSIHAYSLGNQKECLSGLPSLMRQRGCRSMVCMLWYKRYSLAS